MKISKEKIRQIITEELTSLIAPGLGKDVRFTTEASGPSLGDLQSDEKFTGGSPEERMLTLIRAREVLAAMSEEELTQLSKSLDAETTRWLQHLLANPMYAKTQSVTSTGPWAPEK